MKTILQSAPYLIVGMVVFIFFAIIVMKTLGHCRDNKDQYDREIDKEFERHRSPKP